MGLSASFEELSPLLGREGSVGEPSGAAASCVLAEDVPEASLVRAFAAHQSELAQAGEVSARRGVGGAELVGCLGVGEARVCAQGFEELSLACAYLPIFAQSLLIDGFSQRLSDDPKHELDECTNCVPGRRFVSGRKSQVLRALT